MVSDEGVVPACHGYQHEMHSIGPMCRYAEDLKPMLKVLAKDDQIERLQLDKPVDIKKTRVYYMEGMNHPMITPLTGDMCKTLRNVRVLPISCNDAVPPH